MGRDRHGPDSDRLIVTELSDAARRHAQWRELTEAETAAAVAELTEIAGGRADLLAKAAGVMLGASEGRLDEPLSKAAAELCIAAGAGPEAIPAWIAEGRRRVEIRRRSRSATRSCAHPNTPSPQREPIAPVSRVRQPSYSL